MHRLTRLVEWVSEDDVRARLQRPRSREVTVCRADGPPRSYPRSLRAEHAFRLVVSRLGYVSRTWEAAECSLGNPICHLVCGALGHPGIPNSNREATKETIVPIRAVGDDRLLSSNGRDFSEIKFRNRRYIYSPLGACRGAFRTERTVENLRIVLSANVCVKSERNLFMAPKVNG